MREPLLHKQGHKKQEHTNFNRKDIQIVNWWNQVVTKTQPRFGVQSVKYRLGAQLVLVCGGTGTKKNIRWLEKPAYYYYVES